MTGARAVMRLAGVVAVLLLATDPLRAEELSVGGLARSYLAVVPRTAVLPAPALVVLHGGTGSAEGIRRYVDIDRAAAARGVVLLFPQGIDERWNDGRTITGPDPSATTTAQDVDFLLAMIEQEAARGVVDRTRVGVAGISNGGMMAQRLACDAPDRIGAIAVVAATTAVGLECPAGPPVPAIFFNGTEDRMIPYGGGPIAQRLGIDRGQAYSAARSLELWAARNRCGQPVLDVQRDERPLDGTSVRIHRWQDCAVALVQVVIEGGGHTWPGAAAPLYGLVAGRHSREIDANRAILDFFFGSGGQ
ncbi:MAG: hypothetical protein H6842_07840 [Rhodospirillaceae bacterium]|nr:hypothetical protein [Rhodospirillaceae bacterium]